MKGEVTAQAEYGIGVSVIAIAATLGLLAYQRYVIGKTKSVAITADHVLYQSDVLLNLAVIAALALDQYAGIKWADPVFGIAIAAALSLGAWRASTQAIDQLMDREWPEEKRQHFLRVAARHPELEGIHDLRTRTSGTQDFRSVSRVDEPEYDRCGGAPRDGRSRRQAGARVPSDRNPYTHRSRGAGRQGRRAAQPSCRGSDTMKIPFAQIDAFADRPFTGNPAAVMPLDAWLDDATLQAIAQENNLSETAFIIPDASGAADYELRWHTPAAEVALCGHATLASGHYVLHADPARASVSFRTRQAGVLEVSRDGDGYALGAPVMGTNGNAAPRDCRGFGHFVPGRDALA